MTTKRNTVQRGVVLSAVNSLKNHPTAETVFQKISNEYPTISKGTVYRNLNQLANSGEISKIEVPSEADRFDHMTFPHYHTKCTECGEVFDVEMDYLHGLENSIKNKNGFSFCEHTISFKGVCLECQTKK